MKNILRILPILCLLPTLFGFTLLSGPNEAKLSATVDDPTIKFLWDGSVPKIDDKDKYLDGKYKDLSDADFMAKLLDRAFNVWNSVKGSYLRMEVAKQSDASIDQNDLKNSIAAKGGVNLSAAAFANPILSDDKDTIEDCDITISKSMSTTGEDLLYTLVHEIGHCVGLGHNHSNYKSIMGYSRTNRNAVLGLDDKAGIIYLYPDPAYDSKNKEFLGCAAIGKRTDATGLALVLLFLIPALVALGIRPRLSQRR